MISNNLIRHDANLVASSIIELICDDLKYQDKQNDPQYMMLNTKLREDKRINKMKKQAERKNNKPLKKQDKTKAGSKKKSKFSNKYSDRIASIREADEKIRKKEEENKKKKQKSSSTKNTVKREQPKNTKPKSARGRKKTPQQIREEMLKELENSKLK